MRVVIHNIYQPANHIDYSHRFKRRVSDPCSGNSHKSLKCQDLPAKGNTHGASHRSKKKKFFTRICLHDHSQIIFPFRLKKAVFFDVIQQPPQEPSFGLINRFSSTIPQHITMSSSFEHNHICAPGMVVHFQAIKPTLQYYSLNIERGYE